MRYTQSGIAVTRFTLACDRPFAGQDGKREVDFIDCVVWRKQAENVANYLKKGSMTGVDGRLQISSYEAQDGSKRYRAEVLAESVRFLEPKPNGNTSTEKQSTATQEPMHETDPFNAGSKIDLTDDLPF